MNRLMLHIGSMKTGSSSMQAALARSRRALSNCGINYVRHGSLEKAAKGVPTAGNGQVFRNRLRDGISGQEFDGHSTALFSGELLLNFLVSDQAEQKLEEYCLRNRVTEVRILLLVREPVSHAASLYGEQVRNALETKSIEDFFSIYRYPTHIRTFLERFERVPNVELIVRRYASDTNSNHLLEKFLGGSIVLDSPDTEKIHRSFTQAELELQRAINLACGERGRRLLKPMARTLPDIPQDLTMPDLQVQRSMAERVAPDFDTINRFLDVSEQIRPKYHEPRRSDSFLMSRAQLNEIAKALSQL